MALEAGVDVVYRTTSPVLVLPRMTDVLGWTDYFDGVTLGELRGGGDKLAGFGVASDIAQDELLQLSPSLLTAISFHRHITNIQIKPQHR